MSENETKQNGNETDEYENETDEKEQKKAQREAETKERARLEKEIKDNIFYYERTVPAEMAHTWLTEGAKKDLGITMDEAVLFRLEKGNLVVGLLPGTEIAA